MLVTFKSRLYFAAVLMFFIILAGDFIVIKYINTFRNSSYTQSVVNSTISSLLKIQRNAMGIVYLSKLRKADIKIAKSEKKTFNSSAIDKKIAGLVKEIKMDRVSVLPSINGFYGGFSHENFHTLFGVKKDHIKRPKSYKITAAMLKLREHMAHVRPIMNKLLKNPLKVGPTMKIIYWKKNMDIIIKHLQFVDNTLIVHTTKKIDILLDFFMVLPFLVLVALLLISYYFKKTLLDEIDLTIKKIGEVAKGDLRSKIIMNINPKNEIGKLVNHVNTLIDSLSNNVSMISSAVNSISSSGTELTSSSKELEENIMKMKQNGSSILESIKQITLAIMEVAKNSSSGAQEAELTNKATDEGYNAVQNVINEINSIEKAVNKASAVIEQLGASSQRIGEIIAVIDEIADQTNLLALNAAIEAARAGEQGKGFAVVADEVRKLAERTTKATKEITGMVVSIQEDTGKAVESMNYGKEEVKNGVIVAKKAGEQIEAIKELTNKLKDMITLIATAAEEQSTATEEISNSSDSILHSQELAFSSSTQVNEAAASLSKLAVELSNTVNVFKFNL
ncbi:MAG: methyl-accepting chemotaxis protein [bacterium]